MKQEHMTDEQKYWFLKGYIECLAVDLCVNHNLSEKEAWRYLIRKFSPIVYQ